MPEIPKRSKRPKVTSIRTTKVNDPYVAKIYFKYEIDGNLKDNGIFEVLNFISISIPDHDEELLISNSLYQSDDNEISLNVQPMPNIMVDNFFNPLEDNSELTIRVNYVGENSNGHPTSITDTFDDVQYNYPD